MRLEDTAIVVTGAAHGIGRAMAAGFVREGARVTGIDVDGAALDEAVAGFEGAGEAVGVAADVRDETAVASAMERACRAQGPVDVLVNNAGVKQLTVVGDERATWEVPVETWDTVLDTNLRGPFLCARAVLPAMLDRGAGRLIHVTSGHGWAARERRAPYVASKFGLEGFHQTLALELAGTGVDSVAFAPPGGGVRTREAAFVEDPASLDHEPAVVVSPAVELAAGAGENGGRYRGTPDGEGFERRPR
jgi:3-oxoacyl-[acyl-carrier protein] reductase